MRKHVIVLSVIVALVVLAVLVLSVVSAAPAAQKVVFTKTVSNPAPRVGEVLTFTLIISPTSGMTQDMNLRVTDPNPVSAYLEIITPTITGGAYYSSTFDGVVWNQVLSSTGSFSSPFYVSFQVRVTGIPSTYLASGRLVTNTATMFDMSNPTTLNLPASAAIRIMPRRIFLPLVCRNQGG